MMKKRIIILAVLVVLLIGGVVVGVYANGNSAKDNETKTTAKKTTSTPKKTTDTKKTEPTKDSVTDDKGVVTKGSSDVEKNAPAKSNGSSTDTSTPAFSLSATGFKTSNVSSVLGGTVTTTYLSSSPSFEKIFEYLTIEVNQYKVEHVVGANKSVSASNPESYLANKNGYVITLDLSIKNTSSKDKMYKADQITLVGANEFVGGSLDNFVPSNFHLIGSKADPNIFTAGKTARGLLTFTMTEDVYNDLAADSKIGVPNPDKFDASVSAANAGDDVVVSFPVK
ncbi:DUF5068 domain-containing protein [Listeria sp. FSL L7-0233]|nr:DUF5068 domain-containing protein [Listeria marthii]MBC2182363.1 DUF5068 domain-containing protein [Listeria cossartiae subsp. cossartiae]MBC2084389.1 DUF5068 domain-containing protein [Listeria marthii]MBC2191417.1 DUF5068 domain-containing protein [Listeria cossartiae subsp. cossartiae]MBF2513005.1 DUF5068 domain-containing protein [Listeria marthii]